MGEAGIWIAVILTGTVALGVWEYARSSGTFAARWEQVKVSLLAAGLILLGVTSAVLTALYIVVVVLVEIWQPLLIIVAVICGLIASYVWLNRARQ
ncbi:MAG: hypothetical protein VYC44_02600 [Chloroflexota bacterium]|nr:hypothetical protein [Chloroflexota bacterium]MEE3249725.1 hypothetical protein [Chloroflexota bacterium]